MDILEKIRKMRIQRGWTEYELARRANMTQTTISSWYRKNIVPTIPSLQNICAAFDITLAQFFTDEAESLTARQKEILLAWNRLEPEQQSRLLGFLQNL